MQFIELLKIIFLGIVEGITEWLPISSTGHMLLVDEFVTLDMSAAFKEMFFVVIQLGAILAVVVIFWEKLFPLKRNGEQGSVVVKKDVIMMWAKVVVACIPTGVLGVLLDDILEEYFGGPISISIMLIVYGVAFIIVEQWNKKRKPKISAVSEMSPAMALKFGLFQSLAMIPGTSRSGATIIGGLLMGVSRTTAAEFSFFLAIPTMLGASLFKLVKFGFDFTGVETLTLLIGMVVAFIVSLLAIRFLMGYIRKHDFKIFGLYRIVLGVIVIAVTLLL